MIDFTIKFKYIIHGIGKVAGSSAVMLGNLLNSPLAMCDIIVRKNSEVHL